MVAEVIFKVHLLKREYLFDSEKSVEKSRSRSSFFWRKFVWRGEL
nr:MAG TPA: hypothetical protein [Caudoviricetes sp.]